MKVNDPNLASQVSNQASTGTHQVREAAAPGIGAGKSKAPDQIGTASDDVHLSELVRSLRALASDSPERQSRIEQLARAHADGSYQVDSQALASKLIDNALES